MKPRLERVLSEWPSAIIADRDIYSFFGDYTRKNQNDMIQRAVSWSWLTRVKRGLYVIGPPFHKEQPSRFELAQQIYGPSYISMQSALSYHQMIPEAVHATVSVTAKRSKEFNTPFGLFIFHHVPMSSFFEGVNRINDRNSVYLIASPLKALGDYVYVNKKNYKTMTELESDLRIEKKDLSTLLLSDINSLKTNYGSKRVQKFYQQLQMELNNEC